MDDALDSILRGLIRTERSRRKTPAATEIAQALEGIPPGHSYRRIALDRKVAEEYESRAKYALAIAKRVINEAGLTWTSERSAELLHLLQNELMTDWEELIELIRQRSRGDKQIRMVELESAKERARSEAEHELALLVYRPDRSRTPIAEQLTAPRYQPVVPAWRKAHQLVDQPLPDYPNAAKEAVNAVEQLARVVTATPNGTLGDAIKHLRATGRVQAPLLKGLEELWGWTSTTPGVRHGSSDTLVIDAPTARYVLAQADAALAQRMRPNPRLDLLGARKAGTRADRLAPIRG